MNFIEAVNQMISTRRSVYTNMFSGEEVPDSIIMQMLENANWAPTHRLTEPWRFIIFKGAGLEKLGNYQGELYKNKSGENYKEEVFDKFKNLDSIVNCWIWGYQFSMLVMNHFSGLISSVVYFSKPVL